MKGIGQGVPRDEQIPDIAPAPLEVKQSGLYMDSSGTVYEVDTLGDVQYSSEASIRDQFTNPNLFKLGPMKHEFLRLADADDLKKYNDILEKATGDNPVYVVDCNDKHFFEGNIYVLLGYRTVLYKILTPKE